jgi:hypothetical protein
MWLLDGLLFLGSFDPAWCEDKPKIFLGAIGRAENSNVFLKLSSLRTISTSKEITLRKVF